MKLQKPSNLDKKLKEIRTDYNCDMHQALWSLVMKECEKAGMPPGFYGNFNSIEKVVAFIRALGKAAGAPIKIELSKPRNLGLKAQKKFSEKWKRVRQ